MYGLHWMLEVERDVSMMNMIPRLARLERIAYGDSLTAETRISCTSACGENNIYDSRG